jgi:predicted metal-dependent hydrolase
MIWRRRNPSNQIAIEELTVHLVRKSIRNMHLRVYPPDGRIQVSAPMRLSEKTIRRFVLSKIDWVRRMQAQFTHQPQHFITGEHHPFMGQHYSLNVIEHDAAPKVILTDTLTLYTRPNSTTGQRQLILENWYRQQLRLLVPPLIEKWEGPMGVRCNDWGIRKMRTRWGTCNITDRRIWIGLELAKRPHHCLEYIVVHELTHLLERLHNARFWGYMDRFLPDWRAHRAELNHHC